MKYFAFVWLIILASWALLGYWITPDNTHLASQQFPNLTQKPPFYSNYLAIAKQQYSSPWSVLAHGKNPSEIWVLNQQKPFQVLNQDTILLFLTDGETLKIANNQLEYQKPILFTFYLGTDPLGRDILSRLIIGTRFSLSISLIAILLTIFIGTTLGLIAGFYEGFWDNSISWLMNVFWALPSSLLAIGIAYAIGKGFFTIIIAISAVLWIDIARIVRLETLKIKQKEFIKVANTLGFNSLRIIFIHILPNLTTPILVISFSSFTTALILEGSLSFLGLGITPPAPSWGTLIFDGFYYIALSSGKWLLFAPAICLLLTVLTMQYLATQWKNNSNS